MRVLIKDIKLTLLTPSEAPEQGPDIYREGFGASFGVNALPERSYPVAARGPMWQ